MPTNAREIAEQTRQVCLEKDGGGDDNWICVDCVTAAIAAALAAQQAETREVIANAWYLGRVSCLALPTAIATGPQLQTMCERDVLRALAPAPASKETPDATSR